MYPAIALNDAIRAQDEAANVVLVGPSDVEYARLVDPDRYDLVSIPASQFERADFAGRARSALKLGSGVRAARKLLRQHQTDVVIGFGSYASGAMVLAGLSLGLWTAIHEGNAVPGVANRLLGRLVQRVYLGTDIGSRKWYVGGRARVFGTPIRAPIAELPHTPRQAKNGRPLRILVLGGFWGSEFLARETPSLLGGVQRLGVPLDIWHQTGRDHIELAEREYGKIGLTTRLSTFIDDMAIAYRWADFVIARSGASVMSELAAVGTPALLVPWADAAHDHQTPNAKAFAESGAGIWTSEHDFRSEKTAATVAEFLTDDGAWTRASTALRHLARPDAAQLIAADLLRSRSAVE